MAAELDERKPETGTPPVTLATVRRNIRRHRERETLFVEAGERMLDALDEDRRVFIVGPVPRTTELLRIVAEYPKAGASDNARVFLDGHHPVVSIGGARLTWAASWFGEGPYTVADCDDVWAVLDELLREAWRGNDIEVVLTPATTGRDLWVRTIPPGPGYGVLDQVLQHTIRSGAGQGRIETMPGKGFVTLHEYDARLAYLALTRRMPVGEPVDLHGDDAQRWRDEHPFAPGRYLVSFYVPDGWRRPGIIPVTTSREVDPLAGWSWPTVTRTLHGPTWCEGSELAVALKYGWSVTIHRVIGWEHTADVFRTWQDRLLRVLDRGQQLYRDEPVRAAMFRSAVRAIALHTIGALNGGRHKVTHIGPEPHAHAQGIRRLSTGGLVWHTSEPPAWRQMSHPEWTATIWGRARARLLDAPSGFQGYRVGALHTPPGTVVAFRTDAIYTSEPTAWTEHDDGQPGRYRYKGAHGPGPWPRSGTDVLKMKGGR